MARPALLCLLAGVSFASASFFQAFSSDVKTGGNVDILVSDSKPLPQDGTSLRLSIGTLNVTHFSAGAEGKQCEGDQLDVGAVLTVQTGVAPFRPRVRIQKYTEEGGWETLKMAGVAPFRPRVRIQKYTEEGGWETLKMAGVAPFRPRVRIQKYTEEGGWETLKMGLLGVTVDLDFTLQQLAGPKAPDVIEGGHNYVFNLRFKDAEIDTPLGKKTACVNLATREVVAKASAWKWFYFNLANDLGQVFYMNLISGDSVVASIKVCLRGPGQCE